MNSQVRFDDSLVFFVEALLRVVPRERITDGWILRDASGHLTFISPEKLSDKNRKEVVESVIAAVSQYCREDSCVLDVTEPGVDSLTTSPNIMSEEVKTEPVVTIRLIDRRIVGHDWLVKPAPGWQPPQPARVVFASLKGGVGRSTALAVVAVELARIGHKILAIDLDLEAPGLGTMLVPQDEQPEYGVMDWFVEQGISGVSDDREFLSEMISPSPFSGGKGLIDVVPAVGRSSDTHPANVLAKLARAYLELPQNEGPPKSFLAQTQELLGQLSTLNQYDAILIDARAGLNESTAASILGLGADILLFGVDTSQTFASYRYLLAHLARFPRERDDDWLYRLRMVHAKASPDSARQAAFRDHSYEIFSELLYRDQLLLGDQGQPLIDETSRQPLTTQQFGLEDTTGPHYAWTVLSDSNFSEFDPLLVRSQLEQEFYQRTYASLIDGVRSLIEETT